MMKTPGKGPKDSRRNEAARGKLVRVLRVVGLLVVIWSCVTCFMLNERARQADGLNMLARMRHGALGDSREREAQGEMAPDEIVK